MRWRCCRLRTRQHDMGTGVSGGPWEPADAMAVRRWPDTDRTLTGCGGPLVGWWDRKHCPAGYSGVVRYDRARSVRPPPGLKFGGPRSSPWRGPPLLSPGCPQLSTGLSTGPRLSTARPGTGWCAVPIRVTVVSERERPRRAADDWGRL